MSLSMEDVKMTNLNPHRHKDTKKVSWMYEKSIKKVSKASIQKEYMIVVVGGVKGGTGKTTIATNLAVMRSSIGKNVLLVDADEQQTAATWSNQRELSDSLNKSFGNITTIRLSERAVLTQTERSRHLYDDIIIDVGGRETKSLRAAMTIGDLFIIPFKPSSFDIWTIESIVFLIVEMRQANPKLKCLAVINQADHRGNENEKTIQILNECEEIECFPYTIGLRKCFKSAAEHGLAISELENVDKKALQEMQMLYDHIYKKDTKNI